MSPALARVGAGRQRSGGRVAATALAYGPMALGACAVTTLISLATTQTGDYATSGPVTGDNAGPAINALLHGSLGGYVSHQPTLGLTSILLRLPLAAVGLLLGGGNLELYRMGAVACLLSLGVFAAWLVFDGRAASAGRDGRVPHLLGAAVVLLSPAAVDAIHAGHPEEVLTAVLAAGAVIAATRGRGGWAALLLGLAVGAKPWALIAVPPVFVALPGQRVRTATIAGGVAAVLSLSVPLADPAAFLRALHGEGVTHDVNAFSLWWPLSSPVHLASGLLAPARVLPLGMRRSTASLVAFAVAFPLLGLLWARDRRRGASYDALAMLALLGAVRCACDSTHLEYYYLAILIPLAAWEVAGLRRLPLVTVVATAGVALIPGGVLHASPAVLSAASVAGSLMLVAYLAWRAFDGEPAGPRSDSRASGCRAITGVP